MPQGGGNWDINSKYSGEICLGTKTFLGQTFFLTICMDNFFDQDIFLQNLFPKIFSYKILTTIH